MKLHPDAINGSSITAYGTGWVEVNGQKYCHSLVISAMGDRLEWNGVHYDNLEAAHFEQIARMNPELVIFGSGERMRFPQPQWLDALISRRIGIETMDTHAACRAFNFLSAEERKVVAVLLLPPAPALAN